MIQQLELLLKRGYVLDVALGIIIGLPLGTIAYQLLDRTLSAFLEIIGSILQYNHNFAVFLNYTVYILLLVIPVSFLLRVAKRKTEEAPVSNEALLMEIRDLLKAQEK